MRPGRRRCARVMAARRCAGVFAASLPAYRPHRVGVICARSILLGVNTPSDRVRFTRGFGTSGQARDEIQRLKDHVGGPVTVRLLLAVAHGDIAFRLFRRVAEPAHLHLARPFDALHGKGGDRLTRIRADNGDRLTRIQAGNADRLANLDLLSVELDLLVRRTDIVCVTTLEARVLRPAYFLDRYLGKRRPGGKQRHTHHQQNPFHFFTPPATCAWLVLTSLSYITFV